MEINIETITLYKRDARDALQFWAIHAKGNEIWIEWGQVNCETQSQFEEVVEGKAGRTLTEQILSRINSRVKKKLDEGYVRDKTTALTTKAVNRLGLPRPMLAKPFAKVKGIDFDDSYLQYKYDGHRCLIHHSTDGEYIAYSRNGKPITSITEILDQVKELGLPRGYTLDGELYHHGTSLQRISSWVKRCQPETGFLTYMVYDIITKRPAVFGIRLEILSGLSWERFCITKIEMAPTEDDCRESELHSSLSIAIGMGYEGLILRRNTKPYEDGKRSNSLVKIKQWMDEEFLVINVTPSREDYAILNCITKDGKEFDATAPGAMSEKYFVMNNKKHFIGRHIQLQFANWTDEGKPFHPVATMWREKQSE